MGALVPGRVRERGFIESEAPVIFKTLFIFTVV
jgi:hypothetical protein